MIASYRFSRSMQDLCPPTASIFKVNCVIKHIHEPVSQLLRPGSLKARNCSSCPEPLVRVFRVLGPEGPNYVLEKNFNYILQEMHTNRKEG
jgi:hypothetical protein